MNTHDVVVEFLMFFVPALLLWLINATRSGSRAPGSHASGSHAPGSRASGGMTGGERRG